MAPLDCEMCYTTHGIELTRVTVVDEDGADTYESFVKPDNPILDYNTRYACFVLNCEITLNLMCMVKFGYMFFFKVCQTGQSHP